MPTVTPTPTKAYAHCGLPTCLGNEQREVDAVKVVTSFSYYEGGGDIPGEEKSMESYTFADPEDAPCPTCGRLRELAGEPRKQYEALSGFDPQFLIQGAQVEVDRNTPADEELAALKAQVALLAAKLEKDD